MTESPDIYSKIAEKYQLSIEEVREAVIYFWREGVKRSLERVDSSEIYVNKLGSYKIKDYRIPYVMPSIMHLIEREGMSPENLEYFTFLRDRLTIIANQVKEKKLKRSEFRELYKQNSRDISEQTQDLGGSEK